MSNRENTPTVDGQAKFAKVQATILFAVRLAIVGMALAVLQGFVRPQGTRRQKQLVRRADITSGKKTFVNYCASCHGVNRKGNDQPPWP